MAHDGADGTTAAEREVARIEERLERGEILEALEMARAAVAAHPEDTVVLHAWGRTLHAEGRFQDARDVMEQVVRRWPDSARAVLDLVEITVIDLDDPDEGLRLLRTHERKLRDPTWLADAHALRADAWQALERLDEAERELTAACGARPDDADLRAALGSVQFDALDLEKAEASARAALELSPECATAHGLLAVLDDRQGRRAEADEHFRAAAELDPERFVQPTRVSEAEFDRLVESALSAIPEPYRRQLGHVAVSVEAYPELELLHECDCSPDLLGLFIGTPQTDASFEAADLPARILLFQRNLENACGSRAELEHEIGVTVRHEVGHALGLEEHELHDAGHG